ncbi:acetyl-CoA carboxylase biotin carboxylase subunit [Poseidonocella sp. HB161398]|uniref:acetyl-CoA carboxylase biotin carboxylase subunit n=1 Tax=Poseidonocella sp. HB161398 TaxID=2320855 RepID=UPI001108A810|nr:acetyl-CoA carboxylase biotin carboxylase subunit [Poseidonocella sp. HB161398]
MIAPRTLMVANRGEIALRILRAARKLGLRTACIHSEADAGAPWLDLADRALCIGPAAAKDSYLNIPLILRAADLLEADLVHPGYGFLSESPDFAHAVAAAGLTFVGPSAEVMRRMGDKVEAKRAMMAAGVPCVPGPDQPLAGDMSEAMAAGAATGYPLIVKAAGGGGGRGMRIVRRPEELAEAVMLCRQEAQQFFGNPSVYIEKFLERPRHVEVQVMADRQGNALWLGARDCSLQRRHQKVIEESPAPGISEQAISALGERCAAACRMLDYEGAGTFEFLYEDGAFNFIEMNTRIQVEHPVTEEATGLDLVAMQLGVAMGEALVLAQEDVRFAGHALECRITAEDAATLQPRPGEVTRLHLPGGPGVRIDTHLREGYRVPAVYDSLIAKLVTRGATRAEALARMRAALAEICIDGCGSTVPLLARLVDDPADPPDDGSLFRHARSAQAHRPAAGNGHLDACTARRPDPPRIPQPAGTVPPKRAGTERFQSGPGPGNRPVRPRVPRPAARRFPAGLASLPAMTAAQASRTRPTERRRISW